MKSIIFHILTILFVLFTISEAGLIDHIVNEKERKRDKKYYNSLTDIQRDIVYNDRGQKLDVHYKVNEPIVKAKPVIILIHGGTWYEGDKVKFCKFGTLIKNNDYIGVIPNYALFPRSMDTMVYDVATCIQWTYNNIWRYGGDASRIIVAGHSSGANVLSLTLIKTYMGIEVKGQVLPQLPRLDKVMLLAGIYDFDDFSHTIKTTGVFKDNSYKEQLVKFLLRDENVSPYDILKSLLPNSIHGGFNVRQLLFYHTSEDELVPVSSTEKMIEQFKRVCDSDLNLQYVYKEGFMHDDIAGGIRVDDKTQQDIFMYLVRY